MLTSEQIAAMQAAVTGYNAGTVGPFELLWELSNHGPEVEALMRTFALTMADIGAQTSGLPGLPPAA